MRFSSTVAVLAHLTVRLVRLEMAAAMSLHCPERKIYVQMPATLYALAVLHVPWSYPTANGTSGMSPHDWLLQSHCTVLGCVQMQAAWHERSAMCAEAFGDA